MMNSIKRLVLTGAAVMLMMSFAAPAMAATLDPNALYQDSIDSTFDPSVYYSPDIGTAGEQIPPEAGGPTPTPPNPDLTEPVAVGPAPESTCVWFWTNGQWEQRRDDGSGNWILC